MSEEITNLEDIKNLIQKQSDNIITSSGAEISEYKSFDLLQSIKAWEKTGFPEFASNVWFERGQDKARNLSDLISRNYKRIVKLSRESKELRSNANYSQMINAIGNMKGGAGVLSDLNINYNINQEYWELYASVSDLISILVIMCEKLQDKMKDASQNYFECVGFEEKNMILFKEKEEFIKEIKNLKENSSEDVIADRDNKLKEKSEEIGALQLELAEMKGRLGEPIKKTTVDMDNKVFGEGSKEEKKVKVLPKKDSEIFLDWVKNYDGNIDTKTCLDKFPQWNQQKIAILFASIKEKCDVVSLKPLVLKYIK